MIVDDTVLTALHEVQQELKAQGEEFSIQELASIVESQFTASNLAFKKGLEVRLPIFGAFLRKHGLELSRAGAELKKLKDSLTEEEMAKRVLELKIKNIEKRKKRQKYMTKVTFNLLKETPDNVAIKNKFDKLL